MKENGIQVKPHVTMEEADEILRRIKLDDQVEDYEHNELGHVYSMYDGSALVITEEGVPYWANTSIKQDLAHEMLRDAVIDVMYCISAEVLGSQASIRVESVVDHRRRLLFICDLETYTDRLRVYVKPVKHELHLFCIHKEQVYHERIPYSDIDLQVNVRRPIFLSSTKIGLKAQVDAALQQAFEILKGREAAIRLCRCATCSREINLLTEFRDELSRKEYTISGMCQKCQDEVFGTNKD